MTEVAPHLPKFELRLWAAAVAQAHWSEAEHMLADWSSQDESEWIATVVPALAPLATQALIQQGLLAFRAEAWLSAEAMFLALEARFPNELDPVLNLARARARRLAFGSAWAAVQRALILAGAHPGVLQLASMIAPTAGVDVAKRVDLASRWLAAARSDRQARYVLAAAQLEAGDYGDVHITLDAGLAEQPDWLSGLWMRMITPPRKNMRNESDQQQFLSCWRDSLERLSALPLAAPELRSECEQVMASQPNFYLAYLGQDFRDDMRTFGAALTRISINAAGQHQRLRRTITRTRRRIGVVSRYFQSHSVSKLFLPLFLGLDPARFETIGICPGPGDDAMVRLARAGLAQWHQGEASGPEWAERISGLDCDVLVYPDLGMNAITHALAALRLAPVQAVMWGHPFTSGLASVDVVLSSALMEPENGAQHYVETLLPLPGLGCDFSAPVFGDSLFRLARVPGRVVALCAQMWAKLGPQHDAVFARLLAQVPELDLHLTPAVDGEGLTLLNERLGRACAAEGVDFATRVVVHPRMPPADFHALQGQADFLLDSIGWSGGVTAFEAFAQGKPIVTLPGSLMRGRHTYAMLRLMELDELIARDVQDYVAIAVRLAREPAWLRECSARVVARRGRLFDHQATQAAFSDWLARVQPGQLA
ncbi:MAG: hypothetical protein IPK97_19355 [Ahniella sp.]|nr:hypothetical protein [Ahniella sp.]